MTGLWRFVKENSFVLPSSYPSQICSIWGKIAYTIEWNQYVFDLGRGKVVGKFTQILPELGAFILILDKAEWVKMSFLTMGIVLLIALSSIYVFGWLYQAFNLDKVTPLITRHRDLMFKEMYHNIEDKNKEKERI